MANREERRKAARQAAKGAAKAKVHPARPMTEEESQQMLMQTVQINRGDAVNRVLSAIFTSDELEPSILRLGGLGGATGVITLEKLQEIAAAAVTAAVILPTFNTDPAVAPTRDQVTAALRQGGVAEDDLEKAVDETMAQFAEGGASARVEVSSPEDGRLDHTSDAVIVSPLDNVTEDAVAEIEEVQSRETMDEMMDRADRERMDDEMASTHDIGGEG